MNDFIRGVVQAAVETFDFPGPILEIGSYLVPGQETIANLRPLFPAREFVGIDMRPGPGVDAVENIERLARPAASVGSVLALNVFEHVERFWLGFAEIQRVLRPDGVLLVSCPFLFHIHSHPSDYWRFTPQALDSLLVGLPRRIIGWHGPAKRPIHVWAIAAGRDYPAITPEQHERFRERIRTHAHQPLGIGRAIRYRLGRLLFGRGPFAAMLDAERFDTELRRAG